MDTKQVQTPSAVYLSLSDYLNDRKFCQRVLDGLVSPNDGLQAETSGFAIGDAAAQRIPARK